MSDGAIAATLAFLVAAASPGPATLAVAASAMAGGLRAGLALGAGLAAGLAFWGLVATLGLGAWLSGSAGALSALRVAGGLYLLWLAWRSLRAALAPMDGHVLAAARTEPGGWRLVRRGLALNLLNPKAVLAWSAALSFGATAGADAAALGGLAAVCAGVGALVYAGWALAFAASPVRTAYRRWRRVAEGAFAALFGAAGARLLTTRAEAP